MSKNRTSYASNENIRTYDNLFKIIIIGDSGVGKSSILMRYLDDAFTSSFISTIGIDFKIKTIMYNGKRIKLQIWDTAGQERFRTITTAYYRGANGILLVYDTNKIATYQSLTKWIKCIDTHSIHNTPIILVGTKIDTPNDREISAEIGRRRAEESLMDFMEVSSKTGQNIEELFGLITKRMYDIHENNNSSEKSKEKSSKKDKLNSGKDIAKLTFTEIDENIDKNIDYNNTSHRKSSCNIL